MSAQALLEELRRPDVVLEAEGSLMHVDAPIGEDHKEGLQRPIPTPYDPYRPMFRQVEVERS